MSDAAQVRIGRPAALQKVRNAYSELLLKHLGDPGPPGLQAARQLGETAVDEDIGLSDMAEIHHEALSVLWMRGTGGETARLSGDSGVLMQAARDFFSNSLLPCVSKLGRCEEDASALRRINQRLEQQAARISHAIHDEPLQLIATSHFVLKGIVGAETGQADVSLATRLLRQIEEQLSALSWELHPCVLDDLGLTSAVEGLAGYSRTLDGSDITVESAIRVPIPVLPARVMYRAIRECLANIAAHIHARKVHIHLRQEGMSVTSVIRDDGEGIDDSGGLAESGERGAGLQRIAEDVRACGGAMTVKSSPIGGTELWIAVRY